VKLLARPTAATTVVPFTPATYDEIIARRSGTATPAVTYDSAMTIAAVYACVRVISEDVSTVPLQVFERLADGGKRQVTNHPLYELLHDQPNRYQTAIEFREMLTAFAILRGRGIAEKVFRSDGFLEQLKPLHPDLVRSEITESGAVRYRYRDPLQGWKERTLLPEDLLIVRGPFGRSVLDYARDTFALALAMRQHGDRAFSRGARPTGALTHPKTLTDKARGNLRVALNEFASGGENEGRPLLLEEGMTWQQLSISNEDAQFVEVMQLTVPEVARFFRVSLHKIQELTRATFSNIEQQSIEHATDTVRPWCDRWEASIRRDLIVAVARFFAEHNLEGLLRGDITARYQAYAIGRQWGWLSVNDIRAKENLNPIGPEGDDYLVPLNMTSADGKALSFAGPTSGQVAAHLRTMVRDAAARIVRKEASAVAKLEAKTGGTGEEWREGLRDFYADHARFVASVLRLSDVEAERYCAERQAAVLEAVPIDETEATAALTDLGLERMGSLSEPSPTAQPIRVEIHEQPVAQGSPAPIINFHEGAFQVHSPVSIAEGAVQVESPVTIDEGAVRVAITQPAAAEPGRTKKIVQRDAQGRITEVIEEPV